MSKGETIQTSSTGAQKAGNLERYDLIPPEALRLLAEHFGRGGLKYEDRNWEAGYEWGKSFAAMNRHLWAFWNGEDIDEETGGRHITAVAWHAFVLSTYMDTHPEFDDRPGKKAGPTIIFDWASNPVFDVSQWALPNFSYSYSNGGPVGDILSGLLTPPETAVSLTEALRDWQWQVTGHAFALIYAFVDGEWWFRNPSNDDEDPWKRSTHGSGDIPDYEGPFALYTDAVQN